MITFRKSALRRRDKDHMRLLMFVPCATLTVQHMVERWIVELRCTRLIPDGSAGSRDRG